MGYGYFGEGGVLAFLIQLPASFHDTRRNDWRHKVMNPQHFESDPADIRIQIRINPEIKKWSGIPR